MARFRNGESIHGMDVSKVEGGETGPHHEVPGLDLNAPRTGRAKTWDKIVLEAKQDDTQGKASPPRFDPMFADRTGHPALEITRPTEAAVSSSRWRWRHIGAQVDCFQKKKRRKEKQGRRAHLGKCLTVSPGPFSGVSWLFAQREIARRSWMELARTCSFLGLKLEAQVESPV